MLASEYNDIRVALREALEATRLGKYGQFEHAAMAMSAEGRIPNNSHAELRFRITADSEASVETDYTSQFSVTPPGTTPAIAAVKFEGGPIPDQGVVLTDQEKLDNVVLRPGASGISAAITDPVGAGDFDLVEDTDNSSGRFFYGALATFEMRTIGLSDYLVVVLTNACIGYDFAISEFYFNGPDDVEFDEVVCVTDTENGPRSLLWDYNTSVV